MHVRIEGAVWVPHTSGVMQVQAGALEKHLCHMICAQQHYVMCDVNTSVILTALLLGQLYCFAACPSLSWTVFSALLRMENPLLTLLQL